MMPVMSHVLFPLVLDSMYIIFVYRIKLVIEILVRTLLCLGHFLCAILFASPNSSLSSSHLNCWYCLNCRHFSLTAFCTSSSHYHASFSLYTHFPVVCPKTLLAVSNSRHSAVPSPDKGGGLDCGATRH